MAVTPQTNATLEQIAAFLKSEDGFVICGHVSPDGDCIGSQLALAHALKSLGKTVTCLLARDEAPDVALAFMPGVDQMVPACRFEGGARVFVGVDVPSRERLGDDACAVLDRCCKSVTIDHHACETTMCDLVYVDPQSASCSMIVWDLLALLVDEVPVESALCAYTGLVTDTGGFCFQNTDPAAFRAASSMVAYGIDPSVVSRNIFQNRSIASLKLDALVVERMEFIAGGKGVVSWLEERDLEALGAVRADVEPLVNTLRSIRGIEVACLLREQDGAVRGSLRAKDAVDVAAIARKQGGGGHRAAAGLTLRGGLAEARELLTREIESALQDVR